MNQLDIEIIKRIIELQIFLESGNSVNNLIDDTNNANSSLFLSTASSMVLNLFDNIDEITFDLPFGTTHTNRIKKILLERGEDEDTCSKLLENKLKGILKNNDLYYKLISCVLFNELPCNNQGQLFVFKLKSKYVNNKEYKICFACLENKDVIFFEDGERKEIDIKQFVFDYFGKFETKHIDALMNALKNKKKKHEDVQAEITGIFKEIQISIDNNYELVRGAVMFCDFLGWKGLWKDNSEHNALKEANELVDAFAKKANEITSDSVPMSKYFPITNVISISDTIAILTPMVSGIAEMKLLEMYAKIGQYVLQESIKAYPLRGAITLGEFNYNKNIMIGPAIDEAANWCEMADWIGIILSPSAQFEYLKNQMAAGIKEYNIPLKKESNAKLMYCVDWNDMDDKLDYLIKNKTKALTTDVASKYIHTYEFLKRR